MMLKDEITEFMLNKKYRPLNEVELSECFPNYDSNEVLKTIKEMKEEYLLMESKNGGLILATKKGYFNGIVTGVFDEHIFVKIYKYEKDLKIPIKRGTVVLPKDTVLIHLAEDETFEKVIKRDIKVLVGEIHTKQGKDGKYDYYIVPQNKKLNTVLKLKPDQCKNLVNGHKVVFELNNSKNGVEPVIKEIIGYKDDPHVDIKSYLIEAEAPIEFSEECVKEANEVNREVVPSDYENREDFTDRMIFTIDGDDAKDFDDAVEAYEREDGGFHIGVHIADVSSFVKEGGAIDNDANLRGTSIYLIYSVIPMLPQILSNGCCSLVPNQERLTMSFLMDIDRSGKLENGEVKLGVIKSKKRFTYNTVNKILEENDPQTIEENKQFVPMLQTMLKASQAIRADRDQRGQLELDVPEAKVLTDENGHATDVKLRYRGLGEKLIEDFMILTNEFVAETIESMDLPFMYRVHEAPSIEKIESFMHMANNLGHKVKTNRNNYYSNELRTILEEENDEMMHDVLANLLLRSLPKAKYDPVNIGHFGLASKAYMQVTSPIRRYPDLIAHRLMKKYLFEPEKFNTLDFDAIAEYLSNEGVSTSYQERRADQLERDVTKMKMAEYMQDKIGHVFKGKVSGFTEKGLFVRLPNTIEGFVRFDSLKDDIYSYEKGRELAYGKKNGNVIKIGMPMEIKVIKASKSESMIDFAPSNYTPKKVNDDKKDIKRRKK